MSSDEASRGTPSSAQDLELVSALISMRAGSLPQPDADAHPHDLSPTEARVSEPAPYSPTRINDDDFASTTRQSLSASPTKPMWSHSYSNPLIPMFMPMSRQHRHHPHHPHHSYHQRPYPFIAPDTRSQRPIHLAPLVQPQQPFTVPMAGPAVLRYTPEQRLAAVRRFKAKKLRRRNQSTVIRYQIRKRLADTRPRLRGRFFKPKPKDGEINDEDDQQLDKGVHEPSKHE